MTLIVLLLILALVRYYIIEYHIVIDYTSDNHLLIWYGRDVIKCIRIF